MIFFFLRSWKIFEMELLKAFYKTCYKCYISSVEPPRNELLFLPTTGLLPKTNECILNMGLVDFENIPDATWGNHKKALPSPALNYKLNVIVSEPLKIKRFELLFRMCGMRTNFIRNPNFVVNSSEGHYFEKKI